jgi:hypothetical protein
VPGGDAQTGALLSRGLPHIPLEDLAVADLAWQKGWAYRWEPGTGLRV